MNSTRGCCCESDREEPRLTITMMAGVIDWMILHSIKRETQEEDGGRKMRTY